MKNFFFVLFLIAIRLSAFGQKTEILVKGAVYDNKTGEPLENVNIHFLESKAGAITDGLGRFSIYTQKLPAVLEISHIAYETKNISIKSIPLIDMEIKLEPKTSILPGVVITSEKIDTVFMDDEYAVLDYEIMDNGILMLVFRYNLLHSELLFTDFSGTEMIKLKILPAKPLQLFKDCLGTVHVISKNKAFQVYFQDDKVLLYEGVGIGKFHALMDDCKFGIRNKLYFSEKAFMELGQVFYYINTDDNQKHLLCTVFDEDKVDFFYQNPENLALFGDPLTDKGDLMANGNDPAVIDRLRKNFEEAQFRKLAYLSPAYIPIFGMGDSVILFNHPKSQIELYDFQDSMVVKIPISYNGDNNTNKGLIPVGTFKREGKWLKEVYVDKLHKRAYTLFMKSNGNKEVKEINLRTGEVSSVIIIPFPYVKKIDVYNGFVYFIYKGWGENQRSKLFRQRLD
ncbi:MAG: carboxypeptidase-like regulatory domain-containing protein [Chlorobi bacterium]|nr:carboxypeptidase-like regulatory domain-containing protein [Chlorobiota bacterium]